MNAELMIFLRKTTSLILGLTLIVFISVIMVSCGDSSQAGAKLKKESKPDPCENIKCNHGTCINGQCDCQEGYSGPSCAKEITPSKIVITGIHLSKFPPTRSNGGGWDAASGPDLLFRLIKAEDNSIIYRSSSPYKDAVTKKTYFFGGDASIELSDANGEYILSLLDEDHGLLLDWEDEVVSGIRTRLYKKGQGFPKKLKVSSGDTSYELNLQYYW